jgi:hypothetical protein
MRPNGRFVRSCISATYGASLDGREYAMPGDLALRRPCRQRSRTENRPKLKLRDPEGILRSAIYLP